MTRKSITGKLGYSVDIIWPLRHHMRTIFAALSRHPGITTPHRRVRCMHTSEQIIKVSASHVRSASNKIADEKLQLDFNTSSYLQNNGTSSNCPSLLRPSQ